MLYTYAWSLVGQLIELPGEVLLRPHDVTGWAGPLGEETKRTIRVLERAGRVSVSQTVDGLPQSEVDLDRRE